MDREKVLTTLSLVAVALVLIGVAVNTCLNANANASSPVAADSTENSNTTTNLETLWNCSATPMVKEFAWMRGGPRGGRGHGPFGFVEVSEEFKENVITIAKSDQDVQSLLDNGYNITGVKPIIKIVVEENGTVVTKTTGATVMLAKDNTGHASVWVDLTQGKVTRIVISTITVIEKASP